jgi:hypothetical protein
MRGFDKLFGELVVPWLYVSAGIICLLIAIFAIRSLFRDGEESAAAPGRLLLDCREMLARGEITEDEYRKIKSRMSLRRGDPAPSAIPAPTLESTSTSTGDSNSPTDSGSDVAPNPEPTA